MVARSGDGGERLDRGLALWFPGPRTATGEDLAELHIHGGRAVAAAVLGGAGPDRRACAPPKPGEFTRRAFANGAIDLAEAEGLADLLAAETETQRRAALANAGGALSRADRARGAARCWRSRRGSRRCSTLPTRTMSPADEAPVRERDRAAGRTRSRALLARPPAERLRDGIRVVLAGPPNAGKSTLLNALVGREAAIVSPIAGTTRDVIEAPVAIDGIAFLFSDTAGLRDSDDPIETIGVARAAERRWRRRTSCCGWATRRIARTGRARSSLVHARCDVGPAEPAAPICRGFRGDRAGDGDALIALVAARAATLLPREGEVGGERAAARRAAHAASQHWTHARAA